MVSDRPLGPGRLTITGLCTIAGLVFGLGIVFAVTPIDASPIFGRRSLDRERGRRDADLARSPEPASAKPASAKPASVKLADKLAEEVNTVEPKVVEPKAVNLAAEVPKMDVPNTVPTEPRNDQPYARMKLNAESNANRHATDPSDSLPVLDQAISHAYQPLVEPSLYLSSPKTTEPKTKSKAEIQSNSNQVDQAFQELARLKSRKLASRSEELSVELNIHELTGLVSSQSSDRDALLKENEDFPKMRPRPTNTNR